MYSKPHCPIKKKKSLLFLRALTHKKMTFSNCDTCCTREENRLKQQQIALAIVTRGKKKEIGETDKALFQWPTVQYHPQLIALFLSQIVLRQVSSVAKEAALS